jgi:hypothetical protein
MGKNFCELCDSFYRSRTVGPLLNTSFGGFDDGRKRIKIRNSGNKTFWGDF